MVSSGEVDSWEVVRGSQDGWVSGSLSSDGDLMSVEGCSHLTDLLAPAIHKLRVRGLGAECYLLRKKGRCQKPSPAVLPDGSATSRQQDFFAHR